MIHFLKFRERSPSEPRTVVRVTLKLPETKTFTKAYLPGCIPCRLPLSLRS